MFELDRLNGISEMRAKRNRFRPYLKRLWVCRKPSTSRNEKMGKAILPMRRIRIYVVIVLCPIVKRGI